jgi:hypothetical protein
MWFSDYTQILWLKEHYGGCGRDLSLKYENFLDECCDNILELHECIVTFHSKLLTPIRRSELGPATSVSQVISFLAYWPTKRVKPVNCNWFWLTNMPYKLIISFTRLETTHILSAGTYIRNLWLSSIFQVRLVSTDPVRKNSKGPIYIGDSRLNST